jgi:hypothetical protein
MAAPGQKIYPASEIAKILGIAPKNARARLEKGRAKYICGIVAGNKTKLYLFASLPSAWREKIESHEAQAKLQELGIDTHTPFDRDTVEHDALSYAHTPEYNRRKFDKYANILHESALFDGQELREWVAQWNQKNPAWQTSYQSIMRARKATKEQGKTVLIGDYGKTRGRTSVPDDAFEYFKGVYLKEGGPSANSSWITVVGKLCPDGDLTGFPSVDSFMRRLRAEVGESAIFLAREGYAKWNRKYASYIERDYDKIRAGQVWVSDHAQIDVAAKSRKGGKPVFGWITSFIDMKTGKALSCYYHEEPPNSDHIFQAFYLAAVAHGLPEFCYIDNGKDYRCRDFAGGRRIHRLQVDEGKAKSMLDGLGVAPIFAKPYNAQAKTIERWHLKIKDSLSRHAEGFRGGNVTERPERLAEDIKRGNILEFETFNGLLQDFIFNFLNKLPSKGKGCKGKSPDDAWNLENPAQRVVSREALKLFCSRTSKSLSIARNGVQYSPFGVTYFAEWMIPLKGTKVYLRIAPDNVNDAWVFEESTDEFLGNACIKGLAHPVAESEIDRAELREAIASKAREVKTAKTLGYVAHVPDTAERLSAMKASLPALNPEPVPEPARSVQQILPNSSMQKAVNARKRQEREGKTDLSKLTQGAEIEATRRELAAARVKLIQFESDRPAKEERIRDLEARLGRLQAMGQ